VAAALGATVIVAGYACHNEERDRTFATRPRPVGSTAGVGGAGGGLVLTGGGGPCVEQGVCGHEEHEVKLDVPNVYFVLDRSGSMAELVPETGKNRYTHVRDAAVSMVQSLGALINVGAALFPYGNLDEDPCDTGNQVFPVTAGDPKPADPGAPPGPVTTGLSNAVDIVPSGGTPVSATLKSLAPALGGLQGRTLVLLCTDGGPNCNPNASCIAAECMPVIEGVCPGGDNCCAKGYPNGGPELCLDRPATVAAVDALHALGIDVYVIGIPGSEIYASVLDQMAEAGGTAQSTGDAKYHKVEDLTALAGVFEQIAQAAISCTLPLADPPREKGFTNVYLDCDVVALEPIDGWWWIDDATVELRGEACKKLKSGAVSKISVVSGCPTELPK
jgi:hypothetical protein